MVSRTRTKAAAPVVKKTTRTKKTIEVKEPSAPSSSRTKTSVDLDLQRNPRPWTLNSRPVIERIGVKIIEIFKQNKKVNQEFSKLVTQVRNKYPTGNHVNKFIAGLSMEYLFCHVLRTQVNMPIYLSSDRETRYDVKYVKQDRSSDVFNKNLNIVAGKEAFSYSLKYKSPTPCLRELTIPDIRLVNTQSDVSIKDFQEKIPDLFLIVPNHSDDNRKKGRLVFIPMQHMQGQGYNAKGDSYGMKIVRERGSQRIEEDPVYKVTGGIELSHFFINHWLQDEANKAYWAEIDVPVDKTIRPVDPIATLLDPVIVSLDDEMFKYRIESGEAVHYKCDANLGLSAGPSDDDDYMD